MDTSRLQVLLDESIQLLLLSGGEGVDLASRRLLSWNQLDGVVPGLWVGKDVEGFLGEYIMEVTEVVRDAVRGWLTVSLECFS